MLAAERHRQIIEILRRQHAAGIAEIATELRVSPSTVNRDLSTLADEGLLRRVRGGAALMLGLAADTPAKIELHRNVPEKETIAEAAVRLIEPGDVIFLEASTTVLMMAKRLEPPGPLTVITNDVFIAAVFADSPEIETIVTGGSLRRSTRALIGPATNAMVTSIHVDKVFMGISALSIDQGITTGSLAETELKRLLLSCGESVIGLADHSKFGRIAFSHVCPVSDLDVLVTDAEAPEHDVCRIRDMGVSVTCAGMALRQTGQRPEPN
jgi:DeoR family fructose operon transcriptional repressor